MYGNRYLSFQCLAVLVSFVVLSEYILHRKMNRQSLHLNDMCVLLGFKFSESSTYSNFLMLCLFCLFLDKNDVAIYT